MVFYFYYNFTWLDFFQLFFVFVGWLNVFVMQECANDLSSVSYILLMYHWVKAPSTFSGRYPLRYRERLTVVIVGWRKSKLSQREYILCKICFSSLWKYGRKSTYFVQTEEKTAHSGKYVVNHTENYRSELSQCWCFPVASYSCAECCSVGRSSRGIFGCTV